MNIRIFIWIFFENPKKISLTAINTKDTSLDIPLITSTAKVPTNHIIKQNNMVKLNLAISAAALGSASAFTMNMKAREFSVGCWKLMYHWWILSDVINMIFSTNGLHNNVLLS